MCSLNIQTLFTNVTFKYIIKELFAIKKEQKRTRTGLIDDTNKYLDAETKKVDEYLENMDIQYSETKDLSENFEPK